MFSDEELIGLYQDSGNMECVAELFERYTHLVYGICLGYFRNREKCRDGVMEIFESLFEKLLHHEVASFKNWLYAVTKNYCLMILRKEKTYNNHINNVKQTDQVREEEQKQDYLISSEYNTFESEKEGDLAKAINQLDSRQKTCIRLLYLEDKSYKDISELTGYSMKEIKSYIQNGRRNLKIYLQG